jgi:hypothetical protein
MTDERRQSEEYAEIGYQILSEQFPELSDVSVGFLASSYAKKDHGRLVFGQCERIQDKYKWAIPFDFTITVFEPNCAGLSDDQLRILIEHEIRHIGIADGDDGYPRYFIIPHDVEDFRAIIDSYGLDWSQHE